MTENYLSGKKRSLKLGVSGHSENSTSLQTVGGVGIGTTNTDKRALYVVGNTEITGVLTASSYFGDGSGLTGVAATDHVATFDLVVAGISTLPITLSVCLVSLCELKPSSSFLNLPLTYFILV